MPLSRIQTAFAYSMVGRLQSILRDDDALIELTAPIAAALHGRLSPNVIPFAPQIEAAGEDLADEFENAAETLQILVSSLLADVEGALLEYADQLADRAQRARDEQRAS